MCFLKFFLSISVAMYTTELMTSDKLTIIIIALLSDNWVNIINTCSLSCVKIFFVLFLRFFCIFSSSIFWVFIVFFYWYCLVLDPMGNTNITINNKYYYSSNGFGEILFYKLEILQGMYRLRAVPLRSVTSKFGRTGDSELTERGTGERREEEGLPSLLNQTCSGNSAHHQRRQLVKNKLICHLITNNSASICSALNSHGLLSTANVCFSSWTQIHQKKR